MSPIGPIANYLTKHGFGRFEPKAVLFDMDGVLYNSMPNHAVAWKRSMKLFGIRMNKAEAYATEGARGIDTIRNMVRIQQGKLISLEEAQRMYDEKTRQFHLMGEPQVMPGIRELMAKIKELGLTIGVVTGSGQRPLINRLLNDFSEYIDERHIVTAYDVKHGKPHADPYLMGMEKAGTTPWQTIVIENAPLGVKAGVASRAFTIAVNTGPLPDAMLRRQGADMLFKKMTDLSEAWDGLLPEVDSQPISQDDRWEHNYQQVRRFIETNKCVPSKHRIEEHPMLNWIKYNRKLIARGTMPADRVKRFEELMQLGQQYRKLNQHYYSTGKPVRQDTTPDWPELF